MNTTIKSALNQIKAEDELIAKTEIHLRDELNKTGKHGFAGFLKKQKSMKYLVAIASAFILISGSSVAAYAYYQTPVQYLSLDINPSVELGINAFDKVVSAEGYNEDGQNILEGLDLKGSTVDAAVQSLVLSADEKGYIAADGSTVISLTSETNNTSSATDLQAVSETGVTDALALIDKEAVVHKDNVALERRDEAKALGITPGKLNLIQKLQAVDPTVTVEEYKTASVKKIMNGIHENTLGEKALHEGDDTLSDSKTTEDVTSASSDASEASTEAKKIKAAKSETVKTSEEVTAESKASSEVSNVTTFKTITDSSKTDSTESSKETSEKPAAVGDTGNINSGKGTSTNGNGSAKSK